VVEALLKEARERIAGPSQQADRKNAASTTAATHSSRG
jgi:hypothetical protein